MHVPRPLRRQVLGVEAWPQEITAVRAVGRQLAEQVGWITGDVHGVWREHHSRAHRRPGCDARSPDATAASPQRAPCRAGSPRGATACPDPAQREQRHDEAAEKLRQRRHSHGDAQRQGTQWPRPPQREIEQGDRQPHAGDGEDVVARRARNAEQRQAVLHRRQI